MLVCLFCFLFLVGAERPRLVLSSSLFTQAWTPAHGMVIPTLKGVFYLSKPSVEISLIDVPRDFVSQVIPDVVIVHRQSMYFL